MKLLSARIRGLGRLADTTIKLNQKVIAIVGPNEAGKTTLLDALAYISEGENIELSRRSRSLSVPDSTNIVTFRYKVEDADADALAEYDLAEPPSEITVGRRAGGGANIVSITPPPRKSEAKLSEIASDLRQTLERTATLEPKPVYEGDGANEVSPSDPATVINELASLLHDLDVFVTTAGEDRGNISSLRSRGDELASQLATFAATDELIRALQDLAAWVDRPDPTAEVRNLLWQRTPVFVLFSDDDRSLQSTYELNDELVGAPPPALHNLSQLAKLDLGELYSAGYDSLIQDRCDGLIQDHLLSDRCVVTV